MKTRTLGFVFGAGLVAQLLLSVGCDKEQKQDSNASPPDLSRHPIYSKYDFGKTGNIDDAIPLALILNELISNAYKFGFPEDGEGEIHVAMHRVEEEVELVVSDNGVGLPRDFDIDESSDLELQLVRDLAEGQLGGALRVGRDKGAQFTIRFKPIDGRE